MSGEGYDLKSLAYEISLLISNGGLFNLSTVPLTTNSTSYQRVGGGIVDMEHFGKAKIEEIEFMAASGVLGGSGIDVQLYDVTNLIQIGFINFLGTDDNLIKFIDVQTYLKTITGRIEVEVNVRKAGPIGPSTFNAASINFRGIT